MILKKIAYLKSNFFILPLSIIISITFALCAFADYQPPKPVGYVNDFAKVISNVNSDKLGRILDEVKTKTRAEIAVVTLNSLDGYPIEDVGLTIGRKWGVGKKGEDNGIVVIVVPSEKKMRIEIGYGLEGLLTDSHAGQIRDDYMIPYFKDGDYNNGITYGTIAIAQAIAEKNGVTLSDKESLPTPPKEDSDWAFFTLLFILLAIRFFGGSRGGFYIIGGDFKSGGFGGGGSGFGGFGGGGFGGGGCSGGW